MGFRDKLAKEATAEFPIGETEEGEALTWRVRRVTPYELALHGHMQLTLVPAEVLLYGLRQAAGTLPEPATEEEAITQAKQLEGRIQPANLEKLYERNIALLTSAVTHLRVGEGEWEPCRIVQQDTDDLVGDDWMDVRALPPGVVEGLATAIYTWCKGGAAGRALLERFRAGPGAVSDAG